MSKTMWKYLIYGVSAFVVYKIVAGGGEAQAGWFNYGRDPNKKKPMMQGG